jgi:hypothetical protein
MKSRKFALMIFVGLSLTGCSIPEGGGFNPFASRNHNHTFGGHGRSILHGGSETNPEFGHPHQSERPMKMEFETQLWD